MQNHTIYCPFAQKPPSFPHGKLMLSINKRLTIDIHLKSAALFLLLIFLPTLQLELRLLLPDVIHHRVFLSLGWLAKSFKAILCQYLIGLRDAVTSLGTDSIAGYAVLEREGSDLFLSDLKPLAISFVPDHN
jgi:hypothetical protein